MAILNKKLQITSNGNVISHNIYTTSAECNNLYSSIVIDGITGYVPLGVVGGNTSVGRVQKGNSTYALKTIAKPVYTEMSWIEPGTYTWTCPAEVYRVRVALCAGGGGQLCCDSLSSRNGLQLPKGEKSTFGELITAFAGNSGSVTKYKYQQGDHTRYGYHITGMTDGSPIFTDKPIETNLGGLNIIHKRMVGNVHLTKSRYYMDSVQVAKSMNYVMFLGIIFI